MRTVLHACVAGCLFVSGPGRSVAADVANGSFEEDLVQWTATPGARVSAEDPHSGTKCAQLTGNGVLLSQDLERDSHDRLVAVSAWVRSEDVGGAGPSCQLVALGADGRSLGTPTVALTDGGTTGWHRVQTVGLLPHNTQRLRLRVHGPGNGSARIDNIRVLQGSADIRNYLVSSQTELIPTQDAKRAVCHRAPGTITPDGDLSDWSRVPAGAAMRVGGGGWYGASSDYGGREDASLLFYTLWDDEALYFAVLVTDDMPAALDGHEPNDETVVVIIYVDEVLRTGYDLLCYFPIHRLGPTACTRLPLGRASAGRAVVAEKDGHIILEAEFPLAEIVAANDASNRPFVPTPDRSLRFDVGMYDSDTVRREHKPIWNTRTSWNQPTFLGWLDFDASQPPWKPGDKPVGSTWAEDVVAPFVPLSPCPKLGVAEGRPPGVAAPADVNDEREKLMSDLRADPDSGRQLRAYVETYKQHWRPQISLRGAGELPEPDRIRATTIMQRLRHAYLAFGDDEARLLSEETAKALNPRHFPP